jgi:hypothetical protein
MALREPLLHGRARSSLRVRGDARAPRVLVIIAIARTALDKKQSAGRVIEK